MSLGIVAACPSGICRTGTRRPGHRSAVGAMASRHDRAWACWACRLSPTAIGEVFVTRMRMEARLDPTWAYGLMALESLFPNTEED